MYTFLYIYIYLYSYVQNSVLCKCETCRPGRSSLQIVGDLRHRVSLFGTQTFVTSIQSMMSHGTKDTMSFDPRGWSSCFVPVEFQSLRTAKWFWYSRGAVVKSRNFAQDKGLSLPLPGTASPAPVDEAEKTELEEQLQDFRRNLRQPAMTVQPPGPL